MTTMQDETPANTIRDDLRTAGPTAATNNLDPLLDALGVTDPARRAKCREIAMVALEQIDKHWDEIKAIFQAGQREKAPTIPQE